MLERDVHVFAHLGIAGHLFQDILREIGRIGIVNAQPLDAVHKGKLAKQLRERTPSVQVQAVIGGILGDDNELPDSMAQ